MLKTIIVAALSALTLCMPTVANAHHASKAPTKISVIKRVYPDLHKRAIHRTPVSWAWLRRATYVRWTRTHASERFQHQVVDLILDPTPANNRTLARLWLASIGEPESEFQCMDGIVSRESSWVHTVWNHQGSGAYGIPQALPGSKMASAGWDWATNPLTQIRWMRDYARGRYGSLCAAYSHRISAGYY